MMHLPMLIQDLAVILMLAGLTTIIFKRLNQPVVLGYLLAGFLAGPHLFLTRMVGDLENITIWGEIGVIFLLFALGLEFSIRKLIRLGSTAFIGAFTILLGMMSAGFIAGQVLGWDVMNSLFLGSMLSMSSTTTVFKALDDMGLRQNKFAQVVFSVLIVEDLFAIILMVVLSTLAVSKDFAGEELLYMVLKLVGYLLFCFLGGILLIPTLFKALKRYLNDETMLLVALGSCLAMVFLASHSGFSAALGAFVMGSIFAETIEAERIAGILKPVKDLFGAIFFVSVGMLINPDTLYEHWLPIVVISLTVIIGQLVFATGGILLSGQPLQVSIQSGFTLTQIGEFAFILASLGLTLGVTQPSLYPVVVAVSVLTTFITPFMIKIAPSVSDSIEKSMGARMRYVLDHYRGGKQTINRRSGLWRPLLKRVFVAAFLYSFLSWVIILIFGKYVKPFLDSFMPRLLAGGIVLIALLLILSPILHALMLRHNDSEEFQELWNENYFNRGKLITLVVARMMIVVALIVYAMGALYSLRLGLLLCCSLVFVLVYITSKHIKRHATRLERQFFENFHAREDLKERMAPVKKKLRESLLQHDLHLSTFTISPAANCVGKPLNKLHFRERFGVNIVRIIRGEEVINIPGALDKIYPYDQVVVAGTDTQMMHFSVFLQEKVRKISRHRWEYPEVTLEKFFIEPESSLVGMSIKRAGFQARATSLIVCIEREEKVIAPLGPDYVFQAGDLVWAVGVKKQLITLLRKMKDTDTLGE